MTYPRSHTVNPDLRGTFLCTTRCVRRAFLFGKDNVTGLRFDHRKNWVEQRLIFLTRVFAVSITGFAVMSNHYHAIVTTEPERVREWSDDDVAERWLMLSPKASPLLKARKRDAILASPERLKVLRQRLGNLSWYMKHLNEPIARMANREDGAKGRFWEGRFHAEALLDQAAITAAMAYVDLNPARAGITQDPTQAEHTALARRLRFQGNEPHLTALDALGLNLHSYLDLLGWTLRRDQTAQAPANALHRLKCRPLDWLTRFDHHKTRCRVRGAKRLVQQHADSLGQRWLWGIRNAPDS